MQAIKKINSIHVLCYCFHSIISDPQIAVKFMAKQHKYERLKDFRLGSVFRQLFGHAAGTASGEVHKRMRSTFDGCYSAESVAQTVDMMEKECKQYLQMALEEKKVSTIHVIDSVYHNFLKVF